MLSLSKPANRTAKSLDMTMATVAVIALQLLDRFDYRLRQSALSQTLQQVQKNELGQTATVSYPLKRASAADANVD